ncbi:MAG: hypothetical protein ACK559_12075, partial [bacterium]
VLEHAHHLPTEPDATRERDVVFHQQCMILNRNQICKVRRRRGDSSFGTRRRGDKIALHVRSGRDVLKGRRCAVKPTLARGNHREIVQRSAAFPFVLPRSTVN